MKVILLRDVRGLGKKRDLVEVAEGFAKNYLLPRGMAETATPQGTARLTAENARIQKEQAESLRRTEQVVRTISGKHIVFSVKTDERGSVFGSITKEMILTAMREHDWLGSERADVLIDRPLKELGEHNITVDLHHGYTAKFTVKLQPQS